MTNPLTYRGRGSQATLPDGDRGTTPGLTGRKAAPTIDGASLKHTRTPLTSRLVAAVSTFRIGAPIVNRVPMRQGETHLYVHGAEPVAVPNYGGRSAGSGATPPNGSATQPVLIGPIVNVMRNGFLYRAGLGFGIGRPGRAAPYDSVRTAQLQTNPVSGGAGAGTMRAKPAFTRVQTVPRYTTQPRRYDTTSGKA